MKRDGGAANMPHRFGISLERLPAGQTFTPFRQQRAT
jgi:hypothetical protein